VQENYVRRSTNHPPIWWSWPVTAGVAALLVSLLWPQAVAQTPVTLTVATQYADGAPLSGMWTTLRSSSGQLLATGFSPASFSVAPGQTYTVSVGNYQQIAFHHWDSGATSAARQVPVSSPATVTAFYVSPSHPLPPPSFTPITHMSDTTVSYGVLVNSPSQIFAGEWVKPSSQLVGDQIDSITLRLQRSGNPPGTFTVGVYSQASPPVLKKSFGIVPTSSLPAAMTDMTFTIPDLYTIQAGDRIGVFYNGASGGVLVMMDKVTNDSMFDGQNTQRVRYGTSWITWDINEDLYMILKQTKSAPTANSQSVTVNENSSATITLSGSDPEGQPLEFHIAEEPAHGVASLISGNRLNYMPYSYYNGPDSFAFVASDGTADSAPATVSINVANTASDNTSDIVVITERENNRSLEGMFVELRQAGTVINSGNTHIGFQVNNGQTYTVTMTNFQNFIFDHWKDTGSTNPSRSININQDTAVVAVYRT
jgi:hypothetical protein